MRRVDSGSVSYRRVIQTSGILPSAPSLDRDRRNCGLFLNATLECSLSGKAILH